MATATQINSPEFNLPSGLSSDDVSRYSRQMLVPDIGGSGQSKISSSKVLIVGAGGLGSAVIATLAGSGVGTIGVIDPDTVDISNLHRQTIHREADSGHMNKALSAARFVRDLNSSVEVITFCEVLDHKNAMEIINQFDVVVDASDNPKTRYMINDACILSHKPLISGSAVGLEGQLTVYNYTNDSPCYRCVYPNPPKSAASCSDSGVVGMVPAIIGNLQALETLKVLAGFGEVLSGQLIMYDARTCSFHKFKLKRREGCTICGTSPSIVSMQDSSNFSNLHGLRGLACPVDVRHMSEKNGSNIVQCSVKQYQEQIRSQSIPHLLLDVREKVQFEMCNLTGAVNVPFSELEVSLNAVRNKRKLGGDDELPIYVICRRGISSKQAVQFLHEKEFKNVINLEGGLNAWSSDVDPLFPAY